MMKYWLGITGITALVAVGVGLMMVRPAPKEQPLHTEVSADLAAVLDCQGKANPPSDQDIETFMTYNGFRVLNKGRLATQQDGDTRKTDIVGIDGARRTLDFTADPAEPGVYFVDLYSEPPTQHAAVLEHSLLDFTEKTLHCEDREVERSENPAEAKDLYDASYSQTEAQFRQAKDMQASAKK